VSTDDSKVSTDEQIEGADDQVEGTEENNKGNEEIFESTEEQRVEGLVIHMLIEKKYPLKKEIVVQMLKLKLESEEESTMALELIRFIKKVLADLESKEED
ncbi:hypothetical protein Tco_0141308, partial [Tanacetum coccineum]